MIVTPNHVATTRKVHLDIEHGPIRTKQHGKRKYRVNAVTITYFRLDNDPWRVDRVHLSGPYIKADGTDAVDSNTDSLWNRQDIAEAGFWALVEQHMPVAQA